MTGSGRGGGAAERPTIHNRAGLDAIGYRAGTHATFLRAMLARLSGPDLKGLRRPGPADHDSPVGGAGPSGIAGARTGDDFAIALLDGWATVADVLTFYQERIATEGYLRTATERFSLVELARLIGYRPRPGLAATTYLAYTVDAGQTAVIPAGSKVQSVPGPAELPRTFETALTLQARAGYNSLPVRRSRPEPLTAGELADPTRPFTLAGVTDLRVGDHVLVTAALAGAGAGSGPAHRLFTVATAVPDLTTATTVVTLSPGPSDAVFPALLAVAGPVVRTAERRTAGLLERAPDSPERGDLGRFALDGLVRDLTKPASIPPPSPLELRRDVTAIYGRRSAAVTQLLGVLVPALSDSLSVAVGGLTVERDRATTADRLRVSAGLFGNVVPVATRVNDGTVRYVDPLDVNEIMSSPEEVFGIGQPGAYLPSGHLYLDGEYPGIQAGGTIAIAFEDTLAVTTVAQADTVLVSALGMTMKVTKVTLPDGVTWPRRLDDDDPNSPSAHMPQRSMRFVEVIRSARVYAVPTPLALADASLDDVDVADDLIELAELRPDLEPGRWVIVAGERTDLSVPVPGAELAMVASVEQRVATIGEYAPKPVPTGKEDGQTPVNPDPELPGDTVHTFLRLSTPLAYRYRRASVVVHGNVTPASDGDSRTEVLGAGDARTPFQTFPLRQPPVTHLPAPTVTGAASTLNVYVNDVAWSEVDDFLDAGPTDRCYVVRAEDDGQTSVVFGDGARGARPPTGVENIRATYRSGLGAAGNVGAGRITVATSRPLGVREVTNPLPATGGADREGLEAIRSNAPLTVRALDRLVSVQDYEDFARVFAGVGSASAALVSDGRRQVVHVTIAGIDDAPIAPDSALTRNLLRALVELGDADLPVKVGARALRALVIVAGVRVGAGRRWEVVEATLRDRLAEGFGPDRRVIGQGVAQAEVLRVMHSVAGVDHVTLTGFDGYGESELVAATVPTPALRAVVRAAPASMPPPTRRQPSGESAPPIQPAEFVILRPAVADTLILQELT